MPTYSFIDENGGIVDRSMSYRVLDQFKAENPSLQQVLCAPMVRGDIEPYRSPMNGKWITSRSEARDDHARHGTRVLEGSESPTQGKIKNAKFAAKRGLSVSEEYRHLPQNKVST